MSRVKVTPRGYALGAEVTGVDATKPVDGETVAAVRQAVLDHIVVYLPGQNLSPEQLRDFSAPFGELDLYNTQLLPRHPRVPEVLVRANKPVPIGDTAVIKKSAAADTWHLDYAHSQRPATFTFLLGKELPSIGGDTLFANMYVAYDTLSPTFQRMADSLEAIHDFSAASGAYKRASEEERRKMRELKPPVVHPLVFVHPETGRKCLYLGSYLTGVVGFSHEEWKPLFDFLMQHATRYEFTYRHRWTVNDLVIWDNRCSLHLAVQDYPAEMRMLMRSSLLGPKTGVPMKELVAT
jgi:taurine dioxygenase